MGEKKPNIQSRPPIVVVLGHVDHGKTTLLDAIRKTNVTAREAGGITQKIGASVVELKDGKLITFIDTPGHAAFSKMRGRGAKVADIAILVVAQDDGVKPQTKEALEIIKDANIPFLVAGTKSDVAGTTPEKLQGELEKEGILFEGRGGDIPFVSVSAKNKTGIEDLLEMISLMADVAELKGDKNGQLEAVVIESGRDKAGTVASAVIRNGKIAVGDTIYAEETACKVKALFNDKGTTIKEVLPGYPVRIFGFSEPPLVGALITSSPGKAEEEVVKKRGVFDPRRLRDDEIPVIIKADNAGSLEAIVASLPPKVVVVSSGVGEVTSSDIIDAKTGNAHVFAFESKIPSDVAKLAETEGVSVERFQIIYELLQKIEEIIKGGRAKVLGKAEILASFPFNDQKVAGCKALEGKITKGDQIVLLKSGEDINDKLGQERRAKVTSLRKQKSEVGVVGASEEFGVITNPQLDFTVGDVLVSVAK